MPSTRPATRRRLARAAEPPGRRRWTRPRSATQSTARQGFAHARATHDEQSRAPPRRRARVQRRSCPGALVRDLEPTARTTSTAAAHTREPPGRRSYAPHRTPTAASQLVDGRRAAQPGAGRLKSGARLRHRTVSGSASRSTVTIAMREKRHYVACGRAGAPCGWAVAARAEVGSPVYVGPLAEVDRRTVSLSSRQGACALRRTHGHGARRRSAAVATGTR